MCGGGWAGNAAGGEAGEGLHSADGWYLVMLGWACPWLQCDEGDPDEPNFVFQWAQKFQILAVVDCKKMDPIYSPPSLQALGLSWLWAGLGIRFSQQDISKKACKQRLKMCLYTEAWLLAALSPPQQWKKWGKLWVEVCDLDISVALGSNMPLAIQASKAI